MINISSGVAIKERKVLLIKRSESKRAYPGCWAFPGGKKESGETPAEAAIREFKEEVGLVFDPLELLKLTEDPDTNYYRYYGNWSGEIQTQTEEIDGFAWYTYEESIKLNLAHDIKDILDILQARGLL